MARDSREVRPASIWFRIEASVLTVLILASFAAGFWHLI